MAAADTADTRDRLLQTAATLMWERSFQATGVEELCQRANARKGSFYHFFPSKTELALAAIEDSWDRARRDIFEPVFSTDESGMDQLALLVEKIAEHQETLAGEKGSYLGCPFGNLGQEMARQDPHIRAALQQIFDGHCGFIEVALSRAEQAGEIPAGDNRQRARNVFALLEGALLMAKVADDPPLFRRVMAALPAVAAG